MLNSSRNPEPDPAPFKVHLLTRAGRAMRAGSKPAFSTKDEAVRFAGRHPSVFGVGGDPVQLGLVASLCQPAAAICLAV